MGDNSCLIYFDPEFKPSFGHWKSMANNLSILCKKSGYEFIHIKDNNTDLDKILYKNNNKKIIFYSYYFYIVQNFGRLNKLAHDWPNVLFYINYLPTTEKIIATDINYLKKLSDYPNFYVLADTDNLYYYLASQLTLNVRHCPCPIMPLQTPIIKKNPITSICYYYNKQTNANTIISLVNCLGPLYKIKINIKLLGPI